MERLRLSVIKEERKNGIFCREREMEDLLWGFREGQALSCLLLFHNQFSFFFFCALSLSLALPVPLSLFLLPSDLYTVVPPSFSPHSRPFQRTFLLQCHFF